MEGNVVVLLGSSLPPVLCLFTPCPAGTQVHLSSLNSLLFAKWLLHFLRPTMNTQALKYDQVQTLFEQSE